MKDEFIPAFLIAIHTPSNIWILSFSPSFTLRWTLIVSPGLNLGSFFQVEIFLLKLTDAIFFFLGGIVDKFGVTLYYGQTFYKLPDN